MQVNSFQTRISAGCHTELCQTICQELNKFVSGEKKNPINHNINKSSHGLTVLYYTPS